MVGKRNYTESSRQSGRYNSSRPKRVKYRAQRSYPSRSAAMIASRRRVRSRASAANFVDTALTAYNGNTTGSIAQLNIVPRGASQSERVGKKIMMKSLQIRGLVQSDAAATLTQSAWMIVYDRRPGGALPFVTDILNTISPNSFLNDAASARFKILYRWSNVSLGNAGALTTDSTAYNIDLYLKIKGKSRYTTYANLGTGAIGDVDQGALYLVTVGASVAGASDAVIQLGFRLRYYDIQG